MTITSKKEKSGVFQLISYSNLFLLATNASWDTLNESETADRWRGRRAKMRPENVAAKSSPSSVPTNPPDTDVIGSPQN